MIYIFWFLEILLYVVTVGIDYKSEYFSIVYPYSEANIQEYKRMQNYK